MPLGRLSGRATSEMSKGSTFLSRLAGAADRVTSTREPHSPQEGHLPDQVGL